MRGQPDVLLVWFNMLAHSPGGICDRTRLTISQETGLPMDRVSAAILVLESPDPESRTPDEEGRRVTRVCDSRDWGWRLVNWGYYRALLSEADRREKDAQRQRDYRLRKSVTKPCDTPLRGVTPASAYASEYSSKERGSGETNGVDKNFTFLKEQLDLIFKRNGRAWSNADEFALAEVCRRDNPTAEMRQILSFRARMTTRDLHFFPRSVDRVLQRWDALLDAAVVYTPPKTPEEERRIKNLLSQF